MLAGRAVPDVAEIWNLLDQVPDPEIPVISVVDLGIVRDIGWRGGTLEVTVTPTYSGCPATAVIAADIGRALEDGGFRSYKIRTQVSPPWTTDWLSKKGRKNLARFGISPPSPAGRPETCPRCGSRTVSLVSQFGSTPCKAQWRCDTCLEPFDYFKCI